MSVVRARAPGRVNLIGEHTDYTGGFVLPMATDLETVIVGERGGSRVVLTSDAEDSRAAISLDAASPASLVEPAWARYVAAVIALAKPAWGLEGTVTTTLPVGAGLSSSAALEVAVALAVGFEGPPLEVARLCQRAEYDASGVPCGIMDQLASAGGLAGHALLIDCTSFSVEPVKLPEDLSIFVVASGISRRVADTDYATRREECTRAAELIGPLRDASTGDVAAIKDPVLRRRARHVVGENRRVGEFAAVLRTGGKAELGPLMAESHASLRDDFEVSTPRVDDMVAELSSAPGVIGARLTGAGFGGSIVVIADAGCELPGRRVRPADGASVAVIA